MLDNNWIVLRRSRKNTVLPEISLQVWKMLFRTFALISVLGSVLPAEAVDDCGEKLHSATYYDDISLYSIIAAFVLIMGAILIDKTIARVALLGAAIVPLGLWVNIHYLIDFDQTNRTHYSYNAAAENTLANIAEAQDRYKSEHDTFLTDLSKLDSHTAGSHGIDPCVRIIRIEAGWNHWYAEAQHVSSPDRVIWDSKKGSTLIKG